VESLLKTFFKFEQKEGCLTNLCHPEDAYQMNWVKAGYQWGKVLTQLNLKSTVKRELKEEVLQETYSFTNETEAPIYTATKDIKIEVPFPDEYVNAKTSLAKRCHTHIWCGESNSYILGLRMGGKAPNLALILKEGSLSKYSVVRDPEQLSNDRGVFYVHLSPMIIYPGETKSLVWDLHWVDNKEDFENIRLSYPNQLAVALDRYVTLGNEKIGGNLAIHSTIDPSEVSLASKGKELAFKQKDTLAFSLADFEIGEHQIDVKYGDYYTYFRFLTYPSFEDLFDKRVHFIGDYQQHQDANVPGLKGGFLSYDNEENRQYYDHKNDYNGGRERVGMGVILARFLQTHQDVTLYQKWEKYNEYVLRELFDTQTGEVFNDYHQGFYFRLYNYPWMINYFYEVYQLTKDPQYVDYMDKAFEKFYQEGGQNFYPIGHHFSLWLPIIKEIKGKEASNRWKKWIEKHADQLISVGLNYPASEVNYEQSIVAPAVSVLLEAYTVTEKQAYLEEAKKHLAVLELFDGFQPDHHLNQVAIRHWDGYWFGKRKILGDTFPHYWSSLSGFAYLQYFQISGDKDYLKKAETSIRASLSLIRADGRGSCAYLYPFKINEEQGEFYDLLANDQDWALYYADQLQQILQEK